MTKKKILESVLVGTSAIAIGVGIGVPAAVVSDQQSSTVDINDPNNPDVNNPDNPDVNNPDNPDVDNPDNNDDDKNNDKDPEDKNDKIAVAPKTAVYEGVINWSEAQSNESLDDYLYTKFHNGTSQSYETFKDLLEKDSEFANVDVQYVENSANYEKSSFEIKVTPIEDYSWDDNTKVSKNVVVEIPKLDKTQWTLSAPRNVSYSVVIDGKTVKDDKQLNSYLSTEFKSDNLKSDNLNLGLHFEVKLVENSGSFANKNFKISLSPKKGFAWTDGKTEAKEVAVSVTISADTPDVVIANDATMTAYDSYNVPVGLDKASNNKTYDDYLTKNFKASDLGGYISYKNVQISYVKGSANYDANQFQISVTPLPGHAFSDKSTAPRIRVVSGGIDRNFKAFDTKTLAPIKSGIFTVAPYLIITSNSQDSVTYSVSDWDFEWEFYRNLSGYSMFWATSTDGGKTWAKAGTGKTVTINKKLIPASGLWIRYDVDVGESGIPSLGIADEGYKLYSTNPIKVVD